MARVWGSFESTIMVLILAFFAGALVPAVNAQAPAPGPAPGPSSDSHAIDQGIAYVLMFLALKEWGVLRGVMPATVVERNLVCATSSGAQEEECDELY
ncbi:hypothetical protein AXG93_1976s1180 [Marchantia polymorpha subsp. ruderalis]|uniref:Uncharacterized protein n=1 Tax=Marchantia polymorpha subsp. ruderalis TaxID=1480154 RepID=A0A176VDG4_MARPO|nr:hypothetical protein AXG93_1976s1180 [Marchantia polymorpha subsp. ruderalis]